MGAVMTATTMTERMAAYGIQTTHSTPEEFAERIRWDTQKWAGVIHQSGARAD